MTDKATHEAEDLPPKDAPSRVITARDIQVSDYVLELTPAPDERFGSTAQTKEPGHGVVRRIDTESSYDTQIRLVVETPADGADGDSRWWYYEVELDSKITIVDRTTEEAPSADDVGVAGVRPSSSPKPEKRAKQTKSAKAPSKAPQANRRVPAKDIVMGDFLAFSEDDEDEGYGLGTLRGTVYFLEEVKGGTRIGMRLPDRECVVWNFLSDDEITVTADEPLFDDTFTGTVHLRRASEIKVGDHIRRYYHHQVRHMTVKKIEQATKGDQPAVHLLTRYPGDGAFRGRYEASLVPLDEFVLVTDEAPAPPIRYPEENDGPGEYF